MKKYKYGVKGRPLLNVSCNSPMIVQDPFELNFNVANRTPAVVVHKFQTASWWTATLVKKEKEKMNNIPGNNTQNNEDSSKETIILQKLSLLNLFQPLQGPD